ncbi:MAG TPA: RNA polymerase sigma factor [Cerasibacillus sp.]|uniref:RNA polymerase sigma factor n=1 Tax=Cerasibacillus sp. TaxID=2498711 RepID=UPI002F3EEE1C
MDQQEKKLLRKLKKGNRKSFRQLYHLYADYALRTAYLLTRSHSDAADVVQETFVKVYRYIDSYQIEKPFKPWFYRILINECKRCLANRNDLQLEIDEHIDRLADDRSYEQHAVSDLDIALNMLNEHERTLLILKYINGFTEKELAELFTINQNTLKSRLYKARQRLKEVLSGGVLDE